MKNGGFGYHSVWGNLPRFIRKSAALRTRAAKLFAPDAAIRVDYEMRFWLENSGKSSRNYVAELPEEEIDLGDGRTLVHPALSIRPDDRIALVGDNGLGKSMLVKKIVTNANVLSEKLLVIPQEIGEEESQAIHADVKRLDRVPLGRVMTLISRLGSRPGRLLTSTTPSPGEIRKILLARRGEGAPFHRHGRADEPSRPPEHRVPGECACRDAVRASARVKRGKARA